MLRRVILLILFAPLPLVAPVSGQQLQPLLDRSEQLFLDGRFDEALALLDTVALSVERLREPAARLLLASQRSKIEIFSGLLSRDRTRYAAALAMLRPHQKALDDIRDPDVKATFISALAYAHLYNGHGDTALAQFGEAIQLYSKGADLSGAALARAFVSMMRLDEHRRSRNAEAMNKMIPEFEAEIEFARRAKNQMALAYNQRHLAAIYREGSKELEKSLDLYQASLETRIKMGFRPLLPASYFSVGEVLADLGRTEAAIEMYKRSVASADAVGFRRYQFTPRIKIGELLGTEGRLSEARSYYTEALQAAEAEAFQEGIDEAHRKLALIPKE